MLLARGMPSLLAAVMPGWPYHSGIYRLPHPAIQPSPARPRPALPSPHIATRPAGAVIAGARPDLVYARRARLAYGISAVRDAREGDPSALRFWHEGRQRWCTQGCFQQLVAAGSLVEAGKVRHGPACLLGRASWSA
jgi:hypothetical protein